MSDAYLAQYLGAGFKERILAAEREQEILIASEPGEATGIQAVPSKSAGTVKMGVVSGGGGMEMASSETPAVEQTPVDPTTLVVKRRSSNPAPKPVSITPPNVERLGKYALLRLLAEGGMGRVYLARRDGADEICVLKTLRPDIVGDDVTRRRFIREAQLAALLHHDNIARLLDAGFEGGTFCIALEYIPGKDLESMMHELYARRRLLPFPVSVSALIGVLDGLDHAHRVTDPKGRPLAIVHRDLSPRNMMLTFEGVAKVIDFGVARASLDDFKTAPGMVMGTFRYVSPEMARAEAVDHRSDIYAAGVVLYELLSGFPVVPPSKVAVDMLRSVVSGAPQPLHEVATQIPVALSEAIAKAMQKKPADRWQTAAEFRAAIVTAVPEWAHTPKSVLSEFLRTWFKDDAKQAGAIVELSHLAEPAERTRTFVLDDAVEPTAVVPMAEFAEVEELLATKTGLVFPEAPEPTRSVVIERTVAVPTRIIDARSQPEQPAHVSVRPSPPSAPARWKGPALIGLGMVLMLAIQVIYTRVTAVPERSVVAVESPAPSVVAASPVASPGALPVLAASPSPTFSPVPTHSAAPAKKLPALPSAKSEERQPQGPSSASQSNSEAAVLLASVLKLDDTKQDDLDRIRKRAEVLVEALPSAQQPRVRGFLEQARQTGSAAPLVSALRLLNDAQASLH
jgi:serine/threonine-protein kinase